MLRILIGAAALYGMACGQTAHAQVIGTLDNFDSFNDTGETAEGFEIDVEDVTEAELTRTFPSNFSSTLWVIRYGLPTVTSYDNTATGGHKGIRVTWAATWNGSKWVATYGSQPYGAGLVAGDGTPYVKNPTYTNGDSCWYYGLGAQYPTSGCDHFGLSFALGVRPGRTSYHWKVPNKAIPGTLVNSPNVASIPPSPVYAYVPPNPAVALPPHVVAVAEAPEPVVPEPQWGKAYLVKTFTSFAKAPANLDQLQKAKVPMRNTPKTKVRISWGLLQRAPAGAEAAEKVEQDDDAMVNGDVAVVRRYEYYDFNGLYDAETHEAICAPEPVGGNGPCFPPRAYTYVDPATGASKRYVEKGKFLGAHMNGFNIP